MIGSTKQAILFAFRFSFFSCLFLFTAFLIGKGFFPPDSLPAGTKDEDRLTIVIDAGHGGRDGGAVADDDGTLEKHLNLAVAKKLQALLESADIRVIMTRETDTELALPDSPHKKRDDLQNRLRLAQAYPNTVFISIHMNKFPVAKYNGLQVYYSPNHKDSIKLAEQIQRDSRILKSENNRETKAAGSNIYLLSHIQVPAVLVECGFLSNYEEKECLKTEEYQTKLALSLYCSILNYLHQNTLS